MEEQNTFYGKQEVYRLLDEKKILLRYILNIRHMYHGLSEVQLEL